ncbi:MAG: zinc ribbon domain-containing protein, partial [bacterium]
MANTPIEFTGNYEDLSTDLGYQFKFYCERCRNGYMSSYDRNEVGTAGEMLRGAANLFGGILGGAANASYNVQRMVGGPAHDAALRHAVAEIKPLFKQCRKCGNWRCE